jgi:hypothetical protein
LPVLAKIQFAICCPNPLWVIAAPRRCCIEDCSNGFPLPQRFS